MEEEKICYDSLAEEVLTVRQANERYGNKTYLFCFAMKK